MGIKSIKYILVYLTPAVVIFSLWAGGYWSYTALIILFGLMPLLELLTTGSTSNLSAIEEDIVQKDIIYDLLLYGLMPVQYFTMIYFFYQVSDDSVPMFAKIGMNIAFGLSCGILGINAAHELGHRNTWYEQMMSKMLLLTTLYMHFFIEHNRGHHKNVSTDEDPASSRYGETVYAFYFRTIKDSWFSAWHLEKDRLQKTGKHFWSFHNEMLRFQILQLTLVGLVYFIFGWQTLLFYLLSAGTGCLLLETVNYIEHYGLRRKKIGNRYERTLPIHSWNSNHPLGRLLLLELSRHSDHHFLANRKYQILRHFDESPQMPKGYPGMMILSLIPPLWFKVMHRQIDTYKATQMGEALA